MFDLLQHRQRSQRIRKGEMIQLRSLRETISPGKSRGPRGRECLVHAGRSLTFAKGRKEIQRPGAVCEKHLFLVFSKTLGYNRRRTVAPGTPVGCNCVGAQCDPKGRLKHSLWSRSQNSHAPHMIKGWHLRRREVIKYVEKLLILLLSISTALSLFRSALQTLTN